MVRFTVALATPRAFAGLLLGLPIALPIPLGILNDSTQLNPAILGSGLLSPRSTLSPVTFIIGDPLGDHP
ncbi:MAG: hypothetical protein ACO2O2_08530 [Acidilobaceae archaeon]